MTTSNRQVISVSELNREVKRLLESEFPILYVEGEISNYSQPSSGHWYFTLKDDKAQVRCAMFRNRNQAVPFKPEDGQQVIVRGRVSLYEGRGAFQIIAESLEAAGDGLLRRAFEKLKASLQAEGLFADAIKKPLPALAQHLAIITSPTSDAIRDVLNIMRRRFPAMRASIIPVQVQGEISAAQIVEAIALANRYQKEPFDLILLTRGGGSLEDLWSFNTEPVARAMAASNIPIVSAIGHAPDVSIADFVADLRAPTPSAAAELITPDVKVWLDTIRTRQQAMTQAVTALLSHHSREVKHLHRRLRHPAKRLEGLHQRLDELERRLISQSGRQLEDYRLEESQRRLIAAINRRFAEYRSGIKRRAAQLQAMSPLATLQRGYAIITDTDKHQVITHAKQLHRGDKLTARLMQGQIKATVDDSFDEPPEALRKKEA